MSYKIGFTSIYPTEKKKEYASIMQDIPCAPRKSVVQVRFPGRGMDLAYYNDKFDLKVGDMVYVDGKLEGLLGRVTQVNYNFKIKLSDYKRVIALVDTNVHGHFRMAGSHFVTLDRETLPAHKVRLWFVAPTDEDDEIVCGSDDTAFSLDDLSGMNISPDIAERGHEYYKQNKVVYICVDGAKGYAIVQGSEAYEVEFDYRNREISNLTCSCFCSFNCKHEFAAMLQLRETLEWICEHCEEEYNRSEYFAAISKGALFAFAVDGKDDGGFTL